MKSNPGLTRKGSNSRIVPVADIDDLDDMYNFDSKRAIGANTHSKTTLGSGE